MLWHWHCHLRTKWGPRYFWHVPGELSLFLALGDSSTLHNICWVLWISNSNGLHRIKAAAIFHQNIKEALSDSVNCYLRCHFACSGGQANFHLWGSSYRLPMHTDCAEDTSQHDDTWGEWLPYCHSAIGVTCLIIAMSGALTQSLHKPGRAYLCCWNCTGL